MRTGYNPFEEMERLFDHTRRAMRTGLPNGLPGDDSGHILSPGDTNLGVEPSDDGYIVTADLPGFERNDLDLRFHDGTLTIRAVVELTDETSESWHRRSRRVHEHVSIPGDVIEEEISASYRNGVLEVRLPTEGDVGTHEYRIAID